MNITYIMFGYIQNQVGEHVLATVQLMEFSVVKTFSEIYNNPVLAIVSRKCGVI